MPLLIVCVLVVASFKSLVVASFKSLITEQAA